MKYENDYDRKYIELMLEIGHLPKLSANQRRQEITKILAQNPQVCSMEILRPSIMVLLGEQSFASYTDESGLTEILSKLTPSQKQAIIKLDNLSGS